MKSFFEPLCRLRPFFFRMVAPLWLAVLSGCGERYVEPIVPGESRPALQFVNVETGEQGKLTDYEDEIVVLKFWATWCTTCVATMDSFQQYPETVAGSDGRVRWATVSIDDDVSDVKRLLKRKPWAGTEHLWVDPQGGSADVVAGLVAAGVPQVAIFRKGGVVESHGEASKIDVPFIVGQLLAAEPAGAPTEGPL